MCKDINIGDLAADYPGLSYLRFTRGKFLTILGLIVMLPPAGFCIS
jgi:hypothetical protein